MLDDSGTDASASADYDDTDDVEAETNDVETASSDNINTSDKSLEYEGLSLDELLTLPIFDFLSLFAMTALVDTMLVQLLQQGVAVDLDYNLELARISGRRLCAYCAKRSFAALLVVLVVAALLFYLIEALVYTRNSIEAVFFDQSLLRSVDFFDDALSISACTDCYKDVVAMCLNANGLIDKDYVHHGVSESNATTNRARSHCATAQRNTTPLIF